MELRPRASRALQSRPMACVLGINLSHTGAACLVVDGRVRAAVAEERLSRIKGDAGFPLRAIRSVLRTAGIDGADVDALAVGTLCERFVPRLAQEEEYRPLIRAVAAASRWVPLEVLGSAGVRGLYRTSVSAWRRSQTRRHELPILADLGIRPRAVYHLDHHACHAAAAFHLRPWDEDAVVFTCDGLGDGLAATVWRGSGGSLERLAAVSSVHSIGSMYSRVTRFLGLKPWEHEGKVMGLAPYADSARAADLAREFLGYIRVHGLEFRNELGCIGNEFLAHLNRRHRNRRFDEVAYAVQHMTEVRLREWVESAVTTLGSRRACFGGGVFLNVKANAAIARSEEVDEPFFFPAPGDESIAVGAALLAEQRVEPRAGRWCEPMEDSYWGPDASDRLPEFVRGLDRSRYEVSEHGDEIDAVVASLLAEGEVVARVEGRLEFGPRALGHRSILADPSRLEVVGELNRAVKNRDFWMPFAPAILEEAQEQFLVDPEGTASPYMMVAVPTRPDYRHEIQAAIHGADATARPQLVRGREAPRFKRLIQAFQRRRGFGALLNTSLNLHGQPMVATADDALEVLQHSALRFLAVEGHLIRKRSRESLPPARSQGSIREEASKD